MGTHTLFNVKKTKKKLLLLKPVSKKEKPFAHNNKKNALPVKPPASKKKRLKKKPKRKKKLWPKWLWPLRVVWPTVNVKDVVLNVIARRRFSQKEENHSISTIWTLTNSAKNANNYGTISRL